MLNQKLTTGLLACSLLLSSTFAIAQKAPTFVLPGDNKNINLAKLKGKVVYLDFWASWCDPCRKSFPWMNDMHARYDGKNFTIIAVNLDTTKEDATKFLGKVPADFAVAYDPEGKVATQYNLKAMPSSYLIDKKGNLVMTHKGYREGEASEIEARILALLNSK
ncbi:MAG: TlpA disulfide reductase family protein [Gammaproteobacteria bacterium]|nr:TlpA disulfide reductase family protein [Gammaproteobacteria bacterium]